jgi:hypothetical protein
VVIGGGASLIWTSLPGSFNAARPAGDPVVISTNAHGVTAAGVGLCRWPDFIVCVDEIQQRLRPFGIPLVSKREWADIELFRKPVHTSGMLGAVVAWAMGCSPVVLLGMDLYAGGTYWNDARANSTGTRVPWELHLERWQAVPRVVPRAQLRVPRGTPLHGLFPAYEPGEAAAPPATVEEVREVFGGVRARFIRRHPCQNGSGIHHQPGEVVEMSKPYFRKLTRQRVVEPV